MKALLVCEYREGKLLESSYELIAFADKLGADKVMVLIGKEAESPRVNAKVYMAEAAKYGEYNPDLHKHIVLEAVKRENPDYVVFLHSSYGWDLAPRVAAALRVGQVSEITGINDGKFEVGLCNSKLRRIVAPRTDKVVLTIQEGAFSVIGEPQGNAQLEKIDLTDSVSPQEFVGYEPAQKKEVDLTRAEVIVSAGRGIGKKENLAIIAALAKVLGGELGASRPVVDAGWVEHSHQVGTTGQIVAPKLYVACGISGAIQHVAGMKKSEFVVAINKDRDAPIGEVADVLVVADVMQFVPALTAKLQK
ncbi:MAG: electron transfer flavoprotein subunit alpha/FixB family protein [Nitrospirota bacterium]